MFSLCSTLDRSNKTNASLFIQHNFVEDLRHIMCMCKCMQCVSIDRDKKMIHLNNIRLQSSTGERKLGSLKVRSGLL